MTSPFTVYFNKKMLLVNFVSMYSVEIVFLSCNPYLVHCFLFLNGFNSF